MILPGCRWSSLRRDWAVDGRAVGRPHRCRRPSLASSARRAKWSGHPPHPPPASYTACVEP